MQIRIGNKQDESSCRDMVKAATLAANLPFDLLTTDSDLKNIEQSYIGHDGIFLVVEEDANVIAFAAASRGDSEDICLLRRITVHPDARMRGLGRKLIQQTIFFASNLDYKTLQIDFSETEAKSYPDAKVFLEKVGFIEADTQAGTRRYALNL